ncbi:hypothetical protein MN116_008587 [Schistosoma mekongi]|uniref:Uncharacterized protein n=1 Tax=Schistosoma mekongi TaxID=38744 RepID=A0AAE1Z4W2_SCHME|nr:hypothetical protein MN116_008587 [Schistosoma mekongi]
MSRMRLRNAISTISTTLSTTTLTPGITQSSDLKHLDILSRYSRFYSLIEHFSPIINNLDRYISPLWIPIGLISCIICIVIYANPQWRKTLRHDSGILMNPYGYGSLSIYLLILSILHLIQCILVVIMDLDTPWDTGLLAWNNLICPLFHCIWTGNRLAIVLITITLGIETIIQLQRETNFPSNTILRWIIADGNSRKSIRISIGVILISGIFSLIEITYWRVQYYNVEYERIQSFKEITSSSSSLSIISPLEPLSRCEVAGGFQYWFATKAINRYDYLTEINIIQQTTELAASYFDYQWITGITLDCSLALINVCLGLAIVRAYLMNDLIIRPRYAESRATISRRNHFEVLHIATICILQGLCRLPSALFTMLDPLTRPGEMTLTDAEVLKDNTWQRFFLMLSAKVIGIELGDLIAALLMPICIVFCKEFRQNFYGLIKFRTPTKLKTIISSLNPKHSTSRMITPSSNVHDNFIPSECVNKTKIPQHTNYDHRYHHHHQHHPDPYQSQNNSKMYHDNLDPLCQIKKCDDDNTIIESDEISTSERYIPCCQIHKSHINTPIENHSDIDTDTTTYDNTKLSQQCQDQPHYPHHQHHHHHHHHQHDLNSINQCSMNSDKQSLCNMNSEKLNNLHKHFKCMCKSEVDLHNSIPNSLFCLNNKLSNQHYNHLKLNSLTNLSNINYDRIHINDVNSILEYRSYV